MDHTDDTSPQQPRRSDRVHKPPQYLQDYLCSAPMESSCFSALTNLSLQPPTILVHCLHTTSQDLLANLDFTEPQSYEQAVSHPGWQASMQAELTALVDTGT